jgi:hypothetical protein
VTRTLVCALFLAAVASAEDPVVLERDGWRFTLSPPTLAVEASHRDGRRITISRASPQHKVEASAALTDEGFRMTFRTTEPGSVVWPVLGDEPGLEAVTLPRAEGLYVPVHEDRWRSFLREQSPFDLMEGLSMPMWGLRYPGLTVAYIAENPFDNELVWDEQGSHMTHRFRRNLPTREHSVLVRFGGDSPVDAALLFREWYARHYPVMTYAEKIRALPEAERLLGAAHIYLWANSPLVPEDVRDWPGLLRALGKDSTEHATAFQRRSILAGLLKTNKDLATLDPYLVPREQRGAGISPKMIRRLHDAGFDRLWLGVDGLDIVRALPETADLARQYGYLLAPYDSYHSIHSPSEKETWATAQFDQELFDKGGIVRDDGRASVGFNGKGKHLSSVAAFPYVTRRVEGILKDVKFNSWFVDCDATGELFDNYSTAFPQTKEQDMKARLERIEWIRDQKHLVIGSEGGSWYAAPVIHFAHGMMTPLFGWRDPLLHDPQSKYFLGRYYPPEAPAIFMKPVELPEKYLALYYDPRYRLPLFQAAFHDSVVTTNHWSQGSLKFTNVAKTRELLELLYGVPPLYHLNLEQFDKIVPVIQEHYRVFSPLHREIGGMPMTRFEWVDRDGMVQRSVFGNKVEITADFRKQSVSIKRLPER